VENITITGCIQMNSDEYLKSTLISLASMPASEYLEDGVVNSREVTVIEVGAQLCPAFSNAMPVAMTSHSFGNSATTSWQRLRRLVRPR
jgi:hypothetical protein